MSTLPISSSSSTTSRSDIEARTSFSTIDRGREMQGDEQNGLNFPSSSCQIDRMKKEVQLENRQVYEVNFGNRGKEVNGEMTREMQQVKMFDDPGLTVDDQMVDQTLELEDNRGGDDIEEKERGKRNYSIRYTLKKKVLHFTPSWFSVTMGTGVLATLFTLLGEIWGTERYSPFFQSFIRWPALCFLLLDSSIFLIFAACFLSRYIMFPQILPLTIKHPQQSMFLGTIPMGLIVITSNISLLGTGSFQLGIWPTFVAVGMWFLCCLICTIVALAVPWSIMMYQDGHRFENTTATFLLPVVPPVTAAAAGSVIAEHLLESHPTLAFTVMTVAYMQLGIGLPLSLMVLVLYLQRLILFRPPPREVIVSVFLPLGPCGQGGEAILHLGKVAMTLFPRISSASQTGVPQLTFGVGEAFYGAGMVAALLLLALGIWWLVIAVMTILVELRRGYLKFNMGFWSFTFPLASLSICTARLAIELDSLTLKIVFTLFVLANFSLWISVAIPTVKGFFRGDLLFAPCIADLPLDPLKSKHNTHHT